jgi:hypothetical protein
MKTKLIIEIETPDKLEIFPEEGETEENYKEIEKELENFRNDFVKNLHKDIINKIEIYLNNGTFEEQWLDDLEELSIEGWNSFEDYGIKINIKKEDKK